MTRPDLAPWPYPDDHPATLAARNCLLCGSPSDVLLIFVPDDPEAFGAPRGKVRLLHYGLCEACLAYPDVFAVVEGVIEDRTRGAAA